MGAEVVLAGDSYSDAQAHCDGSWPRPASSFVHPFDDPLVIAGQGTIGEEILRQRHGPLDAVFVPVGGGGLIAGVAALRQGAAAGGQGDRRRALRGRRHVPLARGGRARAPRPVGIFADGVAVREVGEQTFRDRAGAASTRSCASTNDEICAAIKDVFDDTRSVMEPAGALARRRPQGLGGARGRSGGERAGGDPRGANMNFDRLRFVAERAEVGEAREALLGGDDPGAAGAFREFCAALGPRASPSSTTASPTASAAHIFVGLQTAGARGRRADRRPRCARRGYPTLDLTDNEMAKLHVRHMVGGRAAGARDERLYRFEFPERPGALMQFLEKLGGRWNISLFHYRNHGADFGRVLAGFEVPDAELAAFRRSSIALGYPHCDESDNPAYRLFLTGAA